MENGAIILQTCLALPYNIKHKPTLQPAVAFLGVYKREMETHIHKKTCAWMLVSTWFIITPSWKQPKCPSVREWTNCGILTDGKPLSHKKEWTTDTQNHTNALSAWKKTDMKEYIPYNSIYVSSRTGKASECWCKEKSGCLWGAGTLKRSKRALSGGHGNVPWS